MAPETNEAHAPAAAAAATTAPGRGARLRAVVETHLGSDDVAHVIYGSIIGLALVVALQAHPPGAGATALTLLGSALAVGLAEAYSELVAADARTRRPADARRVRRLLGDASAVVFGAGFPA